MTTTVPLAARTTSAASREVGPITVGTDGSYWGGLALQWAARYACTLGTKLRVLRPGTNAELPADVPLDLGLTHTMHLYPLLPVICTPITVDPLAEFAEASTGSELLVLGCRGHLHRCTIGLGSLVLPTVSTAHCDVLVVRGAPAAVWGAHRTVTAMVSGGREDAAVLRRAVGMAATYRSRLRIVHASPFEEAEDVLHLAELHVQTLPFRPPCSLTVARALPHEVIAQAGNTDLLVLGRGTGRHAGSVAKAALHHSRCPVLLVQSTVDRSA
ncbi:hypothetical protein GCM10010174_74130 [Kutzneria viridogrisea]|uniref:UspA domain-containing protein n=2 Tax=Kutzneria TaxID=43356 RepID=W5WFI6_9PSEU|nr:universal stress protein [Kutzneria albida]AHH96929.1 hypothetical protein KALB_3565 [Kutzneria albida DSM 43870]MBA8927848.1 nucleotide-binding universal stress UspA family protein [Kutzneria viridogrisea]